MAFENFSAIFVFIASSMSSRQYRNIRKTSLPCNKKEKVEKIVEDMKADSPETQLRNLERRLKLENIAAMTGLDLIRPHADS